MVTGLVAAAVLVSIWLAERPRPSPRCCWAPSSAPGGLTKPTAWAAVVVLPFTLLLFDYASPHVRRRLLIWAGYAALALALGYAITSIARLTPLYDQPIRTENHRSSARSSTTSGRRLRANGPGMWSALLGYLTIPGIALAADRRRRRPGGATAPRRPSSRVWTLDVLVSALLLTLWPYPRYFAAAIVPLSGFAAIGAPRRLGRASSARPWGSAAGAIGAACALAAVALVPAARFDASVLATPRTRAIPARSGPVRHRHERADVARGHRPGDRAPRRALSGAHRRRARLPLGPRPAAQRRGGRQCATATRVLLRRSRRAGSRGRYVVTDGRTSDAPPRPGSSLIRASRAPTAGPSCASTSGRELREARPVRRPPARPPQPRGERALVASRASRRRSRALSRRGSRCCGASRGSSTRRRSRASPRRCMATSGSSSSPRATRRACWPPGSAPLLIDAGIDPVTAMRLLAAPVRRRGGLRRAVVRRLYGAREGLLTAGLWHSARYFLVTASVGIYDAHGRRARDRGGADGDPSGRRPRSPPRSLLGVLLGAGRLTKPTAWAAAAVLPLTLLLFDHAAPERRRRVLRVGRLCGRRARRGVRDRLDRPPDTALRPADRDAEPAQAR